MNKDQVKGTLKDIGGKIQEEFGDAIDSPEQEAKGLKNQVEGKTQKKLGDVREALDDATTTTTRRH
ncbi:CsbD family protein [Massilia consociata]|uniref:CsbD family protein n=1 Tax=Massilia consociata TaxID=760117 RepID=A0ABV6FBK8_9BURK